jgi:benzylsuccinate CoA-transferase BbsE subunit
VVELAHDHVAFAGRLLADLGAEVVLVEPPGGHPSRHYGPFVDDVPDPERSLWWWHHHASKQGVTLNLDDPGDVRQLRALLSDADILLEGEMPGWVGALLGDRPERLIHLAITPFGQSGDYPPVTDLTVLAAAGPAWSCGYDDHSIPPVRGGGNQGFQTACSFAVMSVLTALVSREESGRGQFVDISMHASSNVTTEFATYTWLVSGHTVQRQTGRHATPRPTEPTQVQCVDGRWLNTGVPPRTGREFRALGTWIENLGLADEFDEFGVLQLGYDIDHISVLNLEDDPLKAEIFGAGRAAIEFLARSLAAHDLFAGLQQRGMACGIIYSPEEVMDDAHFVARGFPVAIAHEDIGRTVTYTGSPIRFVGSPCGPRRRAPHVGEHNEQVLSRG